MMGRSRRRCLAPFAGAGLALKTRGCSKSGRVFCCCGEMVNTIIFPAIGRQLPQISNTKSNTGAPFPGLEAIHSGLMPSLFTPLLFDI